VIEPGGLADDGRENLSSEAQAWSRAAIESINEGQLIPSLTAPFDIGESSQHLNDNEENENAIVKHEAEILMVQGLRKKRAKSLKLLSESDRTTPNHPWNLEGWENHVARTCQQCWYCSNAEYL
jgi:hypothetical protein